MKGYELIKEMPNMKIGTKIRRIEDGQAYKLEKVECSKERKFSRVGNKKGIERFMTYKNMHRDFEVIEENKEIEELEMIVYETSYCDGEEYTSLKPARAMDMHNKINELVRAVNKLNKEREEK